jgi:hypothetical protein
MGPWAGLAALRTPTRSLRAVPPGVQAAFALALAAQLLWYGLAPAPASERRELPPAPPETLLRLTAFGEPAALARAGTLWLQYFDQQPGDSVPYRELDYGRLRAWLERWLALAPASEYPLALAVRLYGQVSDPPRQRIMLDFVHDTFQERPGTRWPWLAEATLLAKHRLEDPELALRYARDLTARTEGMDVPYWARDLQILLLEDLGEYEAARILIGGLLDSGEIEDPRELRFLERRLEALSRRDGGGDNAPRPEADP